MAALPRVCEPATLAPDADVDEGVLPFLHRMGFRELTRTRKVWSRQP